MRHYPQPIRPSNPSALEMAIYNFELKAKKHYDAKLKNSSDKAQVAKMQRDFEHLQKEKQRMIAAATARDILNEYREYTNAATSEELEQEEHHPSNKLANYLAAAGEPKPTPDHEAHHIVPGKGRYKQSDILAARLTLHAWNIGINDPRNGVWLINFKKNNPDDWATSESVPHRNLHRHNYEKWVGETLRVSLSQRDTENKLRMLKFKIQTNTMPPSVMAPKDATWNGKS